MEKVAKYYVLAVLLLSLTVLFSGEAQQKKVFVSGVEPEIPISEILREKAIGECEAMVSRRGMSFCVAIGELLT